MRMVKLEKPKYLLTGATEFVLRCGTKQIHVYGLDEFCSVARYFGWRPCENDECCEQTDGSIACSHHSVYDMQVSAEKHLENCVGQETDDPGWFSL